MANGTMLPTFVTLSQFTPLSLLILLPVIDLCRLVVGYCPVLFKDSASRDSFFSVLFKAAEWHSPWEVPLPKARETNILLVLRALVNLFQDGYPVDTAFLKQV
jgi:phospholipase A-2-activating protein